eukprot:3682558-Rhodomonas_salina.1
MSGTVLRHVRYRPMDCAVLTRGMALRGTGREEGRGCGARGRGQVPQQYRGQAAATRSRVCAFASATKCLVLAYARGTKRPVPAKRCPVPA